MTLLNKEKMPILLAEYSALRAQLLQRNTTINQVVAISGGVTAAVATIVANGHFLIGVTLSATLAPILLFMFRLNESDMLTTVARLRELRDEVNGYAGEALLKLETGGGQSTLGYIPDFMYAVRPFDRLGAALRRKWSKRTAEE